MELSPLPVILLLFCIVQEDLAKERAQAVLSVSPQSWLTEGVSVTLSCEVRDSSTGWTFSWYRVVPYREGLTPVLDINGYMRYYVDLLSDSIRGAGGSYTLSPAALHHTGVYVCRAERGEPANQTQYSNLQPLWITGESPPVSLIISPNRTQHFYGDSLSLSCEGQSNSTGWRGRRYRHSVKVSDCSSDWGSVTGSNCTISVLYTSHTGVYWCQSESGGSSNPVNITVHNGGVILESPVHPVTEGDPLTLHCLLRPTVRSDFRADLYKDGLLIQYQTAGEMTIHTVSKSDEGLYHCKHPERGESPHSWVSVRVLPTATMTVESQSPVFTGESVTLKCEIQSFSNWRYQWYKGSSKTAVHQSEVNTFTISSPADQDQYWCRGERDYRPKSSQDSNRLLLSVKGALPPHVLVGLSVGLSLVLLFILLVLLWCYKTNKDSAHTYDSAGRPDRSDTDEAADDPSDVTYDQVMIHNKSRNKDSGAGPSDVTYVEVKMKPIKKPKKYQDKTRVGTDTVYSELRQDTHKGC
ncbi:Fc receptor-like protein 5 [Brachyhypopomus gauderio]|uniref:Fc receptor-like protein 5 n=1 Tax=Brachyhypopomus gauderio TaxID=698409 RepID=UPI00404224CA